MASDESERIRRRMAELRRELECDVRQVGRSAKVMTDWTFYVRKFPWAVGALAVAAGYFLVPKKKSVIKPDPEMLAELVKQNKVHVQSVASPADKPGVVKTLLMMGLTWAMRTGIAYATEQIKAAAQNAQNKSHAHPPEPEQEPGPSPVQEPWSH